MSTEDKKVARYQFCREHWEGHGCMYTAYDQEAFCGAEPCSVRVQTTIFRGGDKFYKMPIPRVLRWRGLRIRWYEAD